MSFKFKNKETGRIVNSHEAYDHAYRVVYESNTYQSVQECVDDLYEEITDLEV